MTSDELFESLGFEMEVYEDRISFKKGKIFINYIFKPNQIHTNILQDMDLYQNEDLREAMKSKYQELFKSTLIL